LFSWILEKIRNWFGLIWIHYANSRKEIRKTENEKEPEQKKKRKAAAGPTREPDQPRSHRTSPAWPFFPRGPSPPLPFLFPFFFLLTTGTHCQVLLPWNRFFSLKPPAITPPAPLPPVNASPSLTPFPFKPHSPLLYPSGIRTGDAAIEKKSLAGGPRDRRRISSVNGLAEYPHPPLLPPSLPLPCASSLTVNRMLFSPQNPAVDDSRSRCSLQPLLDLTTGRNRSRRSRIRDHRHLPRLVCNSLAIAAHRNSVAVDQQYRPSPEITLPVRIFPFSSLTLRSESYGQD
jgi:hypothetical protein